MPLQRRLPKFGFASRKAPFNAEVKVSALGALDVEVVDAAALKAAGLVGRRAKRVKVIGGGEPGRAISVRTGTDLALTKGARAAIESAGGRVE